MYELLNLYWTEMHFVALNNCFSLYHCFHKIVASIFKSNVTLSVAWLMQFRLLEAIPETL